MYFIVFLFGLTEICFYLTQVVGYYLPWAFWDNKLFVWQILTCTTYISDGLNFVIIRLDQNCGIEIILNRFFFQTEIVLKQKKTERSWKILKRHFLIKKFVVWLKYSFTTEKNLHNFLHYTKRRSLIEEQIFFHISKKIRIRNDRIVFYFGWQNFVSITCLFFIIFRFFKTDCILFCLEKNLFVLLKQILNKY